MHVYIYIYCLKCLVLRYVRVFSERLFHDHICLVVSTHGQKHMSQRATNHPKSRLNILNYNYSDLLQEAGIYWEKKHIRGGRALKRTPTKSKRHLLEGPGPEPQVLPLLSSCARPVSQKAALARFFFFEFRSMGSMGSPSLRILVHFSCKGRVVQPKYSAWL